MALPTIPFEVTMQKLDRPALCSGPRNVLKIPYGPERGRRGTAGGGYATQDASGGQGRLLPTGDGERLATARENDFGSSPSVIVYAYTPHVERPLRLKRRGKTLFGRNAFTRHACVTIALKARATSVP
jgi:hypothetical protein